MRGVAALVAAVAFGVFAPSALASSVQSTMPSTVEEGGTFPAHVTGTADEPGLAVDFYVQKAACPATEAEASQQQGAVAEDRRTVDQGSFSLDVELAVDTSSHLTGAVNVCTYLTRFDTDGSTVGTDVDQIVVKSKTQTAPRPGVRIRAHQRMGADGTIRVSVVCHSPCAVVVKYKGRKARTVTAQLRSKETAQTVKLPLDPSTRSLVVRARRKHTTSGVPVTVDATAKPKGGRKLHAHATVSVT